MERGHRAHQDRLIKKMRLQGIDNYEAANEFLMGTYRAQHNARYAVTAPETADYRAATPGPGTGVLSGGGASSQSGLGGALRLSVAAD